MKVNLFVAWIVVRVLCVCVCVYCLYARYCVLNVGNTKQIWFLSLWSKKGWFACLMVT